MENVSSDAVLVFFYGKTVSSGKLFRLAFPECNFALRDRMIPNLAARNGAVQSRLPRDLSEDRAVPGAQDRGGPRRVEHPQAARGSRQPESGATCVIRRQLQGIGPADPAR